MSFEVNWQPPRFSLEELDAINVSRETLQVFESFAESQASLLEVDMGDRQAACDQLQQHGLNDGETSTQVHATPVFEQADDPEPLDEDECLPLAYRGLAVYFRGSVRIQPLEGESSFVEHDLWDIVSPGSNYHGGAIITAEDYACEEKLEELDPEEKDRYVTGLERQADLAEEDDEYERAEELRQAAGDIAKDKSIWVQDYRSVSSPRVLNSIEAEALTTILAHLELFGED